MEKALWLDLSKDWKHLRNHMRQGLPVFFSFLTLSENTLLQHMLIVFSFSVTG
jgi:hypothetical protein